MPTPSAGPIPGSARPAGQGISLLLMVMSGFSALAYQIVWTQQGALWLGHETAAVLAVVAAFFGGLALGALGLGPPIDRSLRPVFWYAGCEALIGAWSLALALLLPLATGWMLDLIGPQPTALRHWAVAFGGTFILLLPGTAAMGATLPAMERILAQVRGDGATIARLYAGNTLGAVLGVLGAALVLVPAWGLWRTALVCAGVNLLCAALALGGLPRNAPGVPASAPGPLAQPLGLLAATGLLGIGYEVLVVRVLSQVAENTVYTFAILLAIYLVGTTLGAMAYGAWLSQHPNPARLRDALLKALAGTCLLGILALGWSAPIKQWGLPRLGQSMGAALGMEALIALMAFLPPTMVMGALFSHLSAEARRAGGSFGQALGLNTLGAALAPVVFGVVLLPALGARLTLLALALGYLALVTRRAWTRPAPWALLAAGLAVAAWAPPLVIVDMPADGRLVSYQEGAMAAVSVVEDGQGVARLHINNRQQEGSSATRLADARQALLPILLHPAPRQALFLGLGTGVTVRSAALDTGLSVEAVELLPEVISASSHFAAPFEGTGAEARLTLHAADARRFVRTTASAYDVIVSDNFHPARSGSSALYTVEHFQAVGSRLKPGGLFCQWLPLHQLDLATLRSIVASFLAAYPHGWAMLATNSLDTPVVGLVGRRDGETFDRPLVTARLHRAALAESPADYGFTDELALLGSFIAGPAALARFAGDAPVNTDDHPVVSYLAPRLTYAPDSLPRDRLISLLQAVQILPEELLGSPRDAFEPRLAAYWQARNRFIEAGRKVQPTADVRQMLAQVQAPLLAILRISPDFQPAYEPLLRMAMALERQDPVAASQLLAALQQTRRPAGE